MKKTFILFITITISVLHANAEKVTVDSEGNVYLLGLVQDLTGIQEVANTGNDISIFPNPATNNISVSFRDQLVSSGNVIVYTMEGRKIMELVFTAKELIDLDLETLTPGIYIIQVVTDDHKRTNFKIVKI